MSTEPYQEKRTEDWARRVLNVELGIVVPRFQRKEVQWHNIVRTLMNRMNHYRVMRATVETF